MPDLYPHRKQTIHRLLGFGASRGVYLADLFYRREPGLKGLICLVFGHNPYWPYDSQGRREFLHARCHRCAGSDCHTYEDGVFGNGLLARLGLLSKEILRDFKGRIFSRCFDCGQPHSILGRATGNHDDCLPF